MPSYSEQNLVYKDQLFDTIVDRLPRNEVIGVKPPFVLLLGPSGIGKTTIINELLGQYENRFSYIVPYTTRELRVGETDKVHVDDPTFNELEARGKFLYVKQLYGSKYGTPVDLVSHAIEVGSIPILDFPLSDVNLINSSDFEIIPIYIFPESINAWYHQLSGVGRNQRGRIQAGLVELKSFLFDLKNLKNANLIKYAVVNRTGNAVVTASKIVSFLRRAKVIKD